MSARNKERGEDRLAAEVNDARAMKGGGGGGSGGGGGEHGMRETARSLATVLRIKVQLTRGKKRRQKQYKREKKCQVSATKQSSPGDQSPSTFLLLRAFIHKVLSSCFFGGMNENARLGAIKRGSPGHRRLRSPLSLRSLHSSLRNHFGPSLGCQTRENWEVGVGALGGGGEKAWTTRRTGTPPLSEGS